MGNFRQLTEIFTPTHYNLDITLDRIGRSFNGTVTVTGKLLSESQIILHAKDLTIESATINDQPATFTLGDNDELILDQTHLAAGEHTATIIYSGTITDAMHGLYPCYYEIDGVKQELLATQFESHHAREVFPCIDEPAGKATFDVTLTTEDNITVLGNMPVKNQSTHNDQLVTTFQTTPVMSPYLLAFVTGDLQKKTATTKHGVEVNVFATKAQPAASLDFALEAGVGVIDFYTDYFDTPYPLPKCDHVALPDFSSGAMENWGLITYREVALLASDQTSINARRYVATVIAHELAHQWFGNLVTMQWWNDLWLNESFATAMEYLAVDALYPDWNIWRDFSSSEAIMALRRDSLEGVQAVHVPVSHPDEISTLFDGAIVYAKGARLLRMVHHFIGDAAFQKGLKSYFDKYAYGNTVGANLWDELTTASGHDVATIMKTWVSQSGFPVVSVSQDGDTLTLQQKQFFVGPHEPSSKLWPIPLGATDSALPKVFSDESINITRSSSETLRLNDGDSAHFITHYSQSMMDAILSDLKAGVLNEITRLQLLNEQTLLVKGGMLPAGNLLPLLQAYQNETSEAVWGVMSIAISELRQIIEGDETSETKLKTFVRQLASKEYARLGWYKRAGESEDDTNLRSIVVSLTLYSDDQTAIETAHSLYQNTPLEQLDPELRSLIIANEVKHYDDHNQTTHNLINALQSTTSIDIRDDITGGLTATQDIHAVDLLLKSVMDKNIIRRQDVTRWYAYLVRNRYARDNTWQWLRDNWQWIEDNFAGDKSVDYFPRYTANALRTSKQLDEYNDFFGPFKTNKGLERVITIGEGEIRGRIEYIERSLPSVIDALSHLSN